VARAWITAVGRGAGALLLCGVGIAIAGNRHPAFAQPQTQNCPPDPSQLQNSSFEDTPMGTASTFRITEASNVPGWETTESDHRIEQWANGYLGVAAAVGTQHVELNANQPSTLYQDEATTPGQALAWTLWHRGRNGTDTMQVLIGPPQGPLVSVATLSDGNTAWVQHGGEYRVPKGQTVTRFAFQAVSVAGGDLSQGNFLDGIYLGTAPCVQISKSVRDLNGGGVRVGDVLEYRIAARNRGGTPALVPVLRDTVAANTTYVPKSMAELVGLNVASLTDAVDGDGGRFASRTNTVVFAPAAKGVHAPELAPGSAAVVAFRVRVSAAAAGTQVTNTGRLRYFDPVSGKLVNLRTNTVTVSVGAAVDLSLTKQSAVAVIAPGATATVTLTVANAGSSAATDARITDTLPSGETFVSSPDGCVAAGAAVDCDVGPLADGQSRVVSMTVRAGADAASGTTLTNRARVSSPEFDMDPSNNVASADLEVLAAPPADADVAARVHIQSPVVAGRPVTADLLFANRGLTAAPASTLTVAIPAGLVDAAVSLGATACPITSRVAVCDVGTVDANRAVVGRLTGTLDPAVPDGTPLTVTATAASSAPDANPANDAASDTRPVLAVADVAVSVTAAEPLLAGQPGSGVVQVVNLGPSRAVGVVARLQLPPGIVFVSSPDGCVLAAAQMLACPRVDLDVDASATFRIVGRASTPIDPTAVKFVVTATSSTTDPVPANNRLVLTGTLDPVVDVSIGIAAEPRRVHVGDNVRFTVRVRNAGPGADPTVTVKLPVVDGLRVVGSLPLGVLSATGGLSWQVGRLEPGGRTTMRFDVVVTHASRLIQTATTSGARTDLDTANNTTFVSLTVATGAAPPSTPTLAATGAAGVPDWIVLGVLLVLLGAVVSTLNRRSG
jgi:uncharacterized repeat protein (TIGR01451 family)